MKVLIVTIAIFCMIGCANKGGNNPGILPREKMQAVMWDIIGADAFTEQFVKKDSLKNATLENIKLQNKIFALHKVTRADYYKSYDYYISQTDLMRVILDSMTNKAERNRTQMMQQHYSGPQPK